MNFELKKYTKDTFSRLVITQKDAHKGENGKVLIIADSDLFHSPGLWAAELIAHFVDMVFYYPPNDIQGTLARRALRRFRNGIVVPQGHLKNYITETDVVLMGPGLRRDQEEVTKLVNTLLKEYSHKKWVLGAGALQVMDKSHITNTMVLTPHQIELKRFTEDYDGTWLVKTGNGRDIVYKRSSSNAYEITGGNEGLTKGGTGDLLAALTAAFYVKNDPVLAAASASYVLKKTADALYKKVGPYYTTSELLSQIPETVWNLQSKR